MDIRCGKISSVSAGSLAADREYGGSCDRCGDRGCRRYARSLLPGRSCVRTGTLRRVLRRFEPAPMPVSLVHAGQGLLPLKLRAFLDFAAPRLKARLAQD